MVCTSTLEEPGSRVPPGEEVQQGLSLNPKEIESIPTIKEDDNDDGAEGNIPTDETSRFLPERTAGTGDSNEVQDNGDNDDMKALAASVATFNPSTKPRIRSSSLSHHCLSSNTRKLSFHERRREMRDKVPKTQKEVVLPLPNKEEMYELLPPDGGWGWVVLLGTVIVNTLIPGLIKSFGVLFVEFITVFKASPSTVAWIPALTFALYNLLGPLASVISTKVSCRFATCLGGLSAAIGLALSYFSTSVEFLYFSYGILGGIGAGMSYTPGVLIVGQYFSKWRGFANGVCASGSALGSIILPPLLNYLLNEYGYRGAILIMCGLILNVCVGAALYQPVSWHLKKVPIQTVETSGCVEQLKDCSQAKEFLDCRNNNSFGSVTEYCNSVGSKRLQALRRPVSSPRFASLIADGKMTIDPMEEEEKALNVNLGTNSVSNPTSGSQCVTFTVGGGSGVAGYTSSTTGLGMGSLPGLNLHRSPSQISSISSSSFAYLGTIHHGSINAAYQLNQIAGHRDSISESRGILAAMTTSQNSIHGQSLRSDDPNIISKDQKTSTCKLLFDASLIKNTVFLIIAYTVVASGIGYTNLLIILPAYAADLGFGRNQYPLLLSIIAGADLVGRIGGASFSDLASFPCKYIYMGGFMVSGLALICMPQYSSYEWIAGCCAVFGLASGIYIGLMAVLLVNHLGADKLASSFGLSLALNGIVMLAGPPIVGGIQELVGSYEPVVLLLGIVIFSGGLILILEPLASRREKRKILKTEASQATVITQVSV